MFSMRGMAKAAEGEAFGTPPPTGDAPAAAAAHLPPVPQASPWHPPPGAVAWSGKRRHPNGHAEPLRVKVPETGQLNPLHPCPMPFEIFAALWGSGTYAVTFRSADQKACGRALVTLANDAFPTKPADADIASETEARERVAASATSNDDDEEPEEEDDDDGGNDDEADDESDEAEFQRLEREKKALADENTRLRAALEGRGAPSAQASGPRSPYVRPPVRTEHAGPSRAASPRSHGRGALPRLPADTASAFELFFYLRDEAAREADHRLDRWRVEQELERERDRQRHEQSLAEQEARHKRSLEAERAALARASGQDELAQLRTRIDELEDDVAEPPAAREPKPTEMQEFQKGIVEMLPLFRQFFASQKGSST